MDSNDTDPSIRQLNTSTPGQQNLMDMAAGLLGGVPAQGDVDIAALQKELEIATKNRDDAAAWGGHEAYATQWQQKMDAIQTKITNAQNFPAGGQEGLFTKRGEAPDFSLAAGTTPLSAQAQRTGGQATSMGMGMMGGVNPNYALGMQGLGQFSGQTYQTPFDTSSMDQFGKQIGGYESQISRLQQGMDRYAPRMEQYRERIGGYEAQQAQQAEAEAAKQAQIAEIQANMDALGVGGDRDERRAADSQRRQYENQIEQLQGRELSGRDARRARDETQGAERDYSRAQKDLSRLTSEQTRDQSEIDRLTGLMGTAQTGLEGQQSLQQDWNLQQQQQQQQARQAAQFNPQQFEQQFGGFDMNDYLNRVGGPMMASAFSTFGNRTLPMIANAFGAQDSARSSGMYDVLGRSAGEMMQGIYGQLAPQAFAAEQASRDRQYGASQAQQNRQLQAAQMQMTGGLGAQQLGVQGGLGMLGYGAQQAATSQQQAQAQATADFQKWQMQQPGMDPRLSMLLAQANQPAYNYMGIAGTQTPSIMSQISGPAGKLLGNVVGSGMEIAGGGPPGPTTGGGTTWNQQKAAMDNPYYYG